MLHKDIILGINTKYIVEREVTELMIKKFVDSSFDKHHSFSHAAGYLEVLLGRVLMELPKKKREKFLDQLRKDTKFNQEFKESCNA